MPASIITKRQLGLLFITAGVMVIAGVLIFDLLRHHEFGGAYQWAAIAGGGLLSVLGATLLPLGDDPL